MRDKQSDLPLHSAVEKLIQSPGQVRRPGPFYPLLWWSLSHSINPGLIRNASVSASVHRSITPLYTCHSGPRFCALGSAALTCGMVDLNTVRRTQRRSLNHADSGWSDIRRRGSRRRDSSLAEASIILRGLSADSCELIASTPSVNSIGSPINPSRRTA